MSSNGYTVKGSGLKSNVYSLLNNLSSSLAAKIVAIKFKTITKKAFTSRKKGLCKKTYAKPQN